MVEVIVTLGIISALVIIGYFSEIIFKRTGIPDVLILILVGILLGSVLHIVSAESFGNGEIIFTTFALVFLLFQGALNIDFKELFKSFSGTLKLTLFSFVTTTMIVFLLGKFFLGFPVLQSLMLGMILGGTSSAVIIPLVSNMDIKNRYELISILESALSDVLCIVGTITIIAIIKTGEIDAPGVFRNVLSSFSLAIVIGLFIGIIWAFMLSRSKHLKTSYMMTIAIVLGLYSFVESPFVSASGAIAALSFGLVLGNSKSILNFFGRKIPRLESDSGYKSVLSTTDKNFYQEISFFVKVFFFIYLGIIMDFSQPLNYVYAGVITLGIFLIRPVAVKLSFYKSNIDKKSRTLLGILVPKGLAAAVLSQLAIQQEIMYADVIFDIVLGTILISIAMTSILAFMVQKGWFSGIYSYVQFNGHHNPKRKEMYRNLG